MTEVEGKKNRIAAAVRFAAVVGRRFGDDHCLTVAASLSFTSLLALVPAAVIGFAVLVAVPAFQGARDGIVAFAFDHFVPDTGDEVTRTFNRFVDNAGELSLVGLAALVVTVVLLLAEIEAGLNVTFRVARPRSLLPRLAVYLAVVVAGPLLVGASFTLATYILALTEALGLRAFTGPIGQLTRALPAILVIAALVMVYVLVPNRRVRWRDAALGALLAGLLFSGLRHGLGLYLIYVPTYKTLYGALAVVPIFLIWLFLSWAFVLLGAVVTASLPEWREEGREDEGVP